MIQPALSLAKDGVTWLKQMLQIGRVAWVAWFAVPFLNLDEVQYGTVIAFALVWGVSVLWLNWFGSLGWFGSQEGEKPELSAALQEAAIMTIMPLLTVAAIGFFVLMISLPFIGLSKLF